MKGPTIHPFLSIRPFVPLHSPRSRLWTGGDSKKEEKRRYCCENKFDDRLMRVVIISSDLYSSVDDHGWCSLQICVDRRDC
jgi:hypothetical protein